MYVPRQIHYLGPAALILFPFWVNRAFFGGGLNSDGSYWLMQYALIQVAVEWGRYIGRAGEVYQKWEAGETPEQSQMINHNTGLPVEDVPSMGKFEPIKRDLMNTPETFTNNLVVPLPKFDKVRHVAVTLIRQNQQGFRVDLTEKKWVDKRGFVDKQKRTVSNWKFSRDEFLQSVIDPWVYHKAIARAGTRKNSPYDVIDWHVIQLYAQGEKLPPLPR